MHERQKGEDLFHPWKLLQSHAFWAEERQINIPEDCEQNFQIAIQ